VNKCNSDIKKITALIFKSYTRPVPYCRVLPPRANLIV